MAKANPEQGYKGNPEAMKWPADKARYDKNYIRLYGILCKYCKGKGCPACNWLGDFDNVKVGDKQR